MESLLDYKARSGGIDKWERRYFKFESGTHTLREFADDAVRTCLDEHVVVGAIDVANRSFKRKNRFDFRLRNGSTIAVAAATAKVKADWLAVALTCLGQAHVSSVGHVPARKPDEVTTTDASATVGFMEPMSSHILTDPTGMREIAARRQQRGLVRTPWGHLHYVLAGQLDEVMETKQKSSGRRLVPLVLLHMSPRSSDEYYEAMPYLGGGSSGGTTCGGDGRLRVAIDLLGYGHSDAPSATLTTEQVAQTVLNVVDWLRIGCFAVACSLTSCNVGIALAGALDSSPRPCRVCALILTNPVDLGRAARRTFAALGAGSSSRTCGTDMNADGFPGAGARPDDSPPWHWHMSQDGAHLMRLWRERLASQIDVRANASLGIAGNGSRGASRELDPELATRCFADDVSYHLNRLRQPPYVQRRPPQQPTESPQAFQVAQAAECVRCPVLLVYGESAVHMLDHLGFDMSGSRDKYRELFRHATVEEHDITGESSTVFVINQCAVQWASRVNKHIDSMQVNEFVLRMQKPAASVDSSSTTNLEQSVIGKD